MEVYVLRKLKDDGTKEQYFKDIVSVYSYKRSDKITLHIINIAEQGTVLFDVVKFEVY